MSNLTPEEQATNAQTLAHIHLVGKMIHAIVAELLRRADVHDKSKLEHPEVELFTKFTPLLAKSTYGSEEYNQFKKDMGPALAHHYANNDHHPEHFKNGIEDMNLVQLLEMFCDWVASSERHDDGNLRKSIEINGPRFHMTPQLVRIFENTAALIDGIRE